MTRLSSFISCCLSSVIRRLESLFSGLASGIWRPASFSGCRPSSGRLSSPLRPPSSLDWRLASGVRRQASSFPCLSSPVRRLSSVVCRRLHGPSAAFSLVEVTLALMVMAIGILSIMSLFPAGLDQNARSIADTHAAFFAEEVFGGLHACAEKNWDSLADVQLPVAASNMWSNMGTNRVHVTGTNMVMNKYEYKDTSGVNTYEDHALRYRLVLMTNGLLKAATLFVWPGEFGTLNDPSMFYAEFFRFRPMP